MRCLFYGDNMRVGDPIYHTRRWRKLRNAYYRSKHGICERCGIPGDIVHHIIHITNENINDPAITFGWDNLELVCLDCHNKEHKLIHEPIREDVMFDDEGNLIERN